MKTGRKERSGSTQTGRKPQGTGRSPEAGRRQGPSTEQGQGRPEWKDKPRGHARPGTPGKSRASAKPHAASGPEGSRKPRADVQRPPIAPHPPDGELLAGRNAVREALRAGRRVRRLYVPRESARDPWVEEAVRLATDRRIPVEEVERAKLDAMAPEHQGLVATVASYQYSSWGELLERLKKYQRPPAVLLLDTLHDPQNFGTLLRTADVLGVDAVVLPRHRSVHVTPAVVRASAGAVEHLTIPVVPNLGRAIEELQEIGFWVAGLDADGDRHYWDLDFTGPMAIVLGGEDHGIGRLVREKCDFLVKLPMSGHVNSLNAAVAGSVVLYEMARQRMLKAKSM